MDEMAARGRTRLAEAEATRATTGTMVEKRILGDEKLVLVGKRESGLFNDWKVGKLESAKWGRKVKEEEDASKLGLL